jgi:3-oxoacyl-[acyl-carrier-protein] synthase III
MADIDGTTPKFLRGRYAIVGVGETSYRRGSQETTRNLATWAIGNALDDAGLEAADVDGMLSYSGNDSTFSTFVAGDLGIRLNFFMDCFGGGSSRPACATPWPSSAR